jgi:integrase
MTQVYRLDDVPRSITWGEVRRMLDVVDCRTIRGRRDYAILLLFVTYGLRAHEVAKLTLMMLTGNANGFRFWNARQGVRRFIHWPELLGKCSSTISNAGGLRPRTVICFSASWLRRIRSVPLPCHPALRSSFTKRIFKCAGQDCIRSGTPVCSV